MSSSRKCMNVFDKLEKKMDECCSKFEKEAAKDFDPDAKNRLYVSEQIVACDRQLRKISKDLNYCIFAARHNPKMGIVDSDFERPKLPKLNAFGRHLYGRPTMGCC